MIQSNIGRDRFISTLKGHSPVFWPNLPNRRNHLKAGVLVPIIDNGSWICILTQRASHLTNHPGEICFPGGKPEAADRDLQHTATREAEEELGIVGAKIIGRLSSIPLYTSDYRLEPFVGLIPDQPLFPEKNEVSRVIRIELSRCVKLDGIDGIVVDIHGKEHLSPIFDPREISEEDCDQIIYGGTAYVLYELLQLFATSMGVPSPQIQRSDRTFPFEI